MLLGLAQNLRERATRKRSATARRSKSFWCHAFVELLALLPVSLSAIPMGHSLQGRLSNTVGQLINGTHNLAVALYDGDTQAGLDTFSNVPVADTLGRK